MAERRRAGEVVVPEGPGAEEAGDLVDVVPVVQGGQDKPQRRRRRREKQVSETRAAYRSTTGPPSLAEPVPSEAPPDSRDLEVRWIEEHRAQLRQRYAGQWIVVERDTLVAHHRDLQEAVGRASKRGVRYPFVLFIRAKRYEDACEVV